MFFLFFIIASALERIKSKRIFQQAVKIGNYLQFPAKIIEQNKRQMCNLC